MANIATRELSAMVVVFFVLQLGGVLEQIRRMAAERLNSRHSLFSTKKSPVWKTR